MNRAVFQFFKPRNTLLLLGTLSIMVGIFLRNPLLLQISAASFSAVALSFFQAFRTLRNVEVARSHHGRAFQGSEVAVSLRLHATEGTDSELVVVEDDFSPASAGRVRRLLENPLRRDDIIEINYFGSCDHRRGLYLIGPVKLRSQDAFGFFSREVTVDCLTRLVVYPLAVDLQHAKLLGEGILPHVGLEVKPRAGVSEEFLGVREYRHGDPPRFIHWKSTARHGRFMVKEFEEEITTLTTFFLDLGRLGLVGIGDQTSVEYGIRCCASLSKRATELGHQIQFFGIGKDIEHVPPGAGTFHLLTILDRLAFLKPEGESGFAAVVKDLVKNLPRGSTAVLLTGATTVHLETMSATVSLLVDRMVLPIFVLIDDRAFIKIYREQESRHVEALPLEEVAKQLQLLGARVHIIRRAKSMEQALLQGLEREGGAA
jgi:uncharacterized protein (DUF58 family)